jgi:hypothetical protein
MFSLPVRMGRGADAIGAERDTGPRAARTVAIGSPEAFWLALIAALFVCWAMSPSANQLRGLTGSLPGCAFTGKAGVICNGSASAAQQVITETTRVSALARAGVIARRANRMAHVWHSQGG